MTIRVLIADDHAVVRLGIRMLLENESDIEIIGEAEAAAEAVQQAARLKPDVLLMDIGLPDMSGIEATREVKRISPQTAVLALTIHEDETYFFKMLEAGASGYVPKRAAPEELLIAIRSTARGDVYIYPSMAKLLVSDYLKAQSAEESAMVNGLTSREQEVLALIAEGYTSAQIAQELNISPKTVDRHRENIMSKLNLHSRVELVKYAIRKGFIEA